MLIREAMHTQVITISEEETLPTAVVRMTACSLRRLPVLREGQLVGMLTRADVEAHLPALHLGLSPWTFTLQAGQSRVGEAMSPQVVSIEPDAPLERAVQTMLGHQIGGLPVVDARKKLIGLLTRTDVLRALCTAARLKWGSVHQHMTMTTISVAATAPIGEAADRFRITGLQVLPVLEGEQLVGVVHARDIRAAVEQSGTAHGNTVFSDHVFPEGQIVRDLMRPPECYVFDFVPMQDAIREMVATDVQGLPVITEGGRLLGVVTVSDVFRTLLGQQPINRV